MLNHFLTEGKSRRVPGASMRRNPVKAYALAFSQERSVSIPR